MGQEAKLDDLRQKIQHYHDMLESCQLKTTINDISTSIDPPIRQISNFSLSVKKTINNREYKEAGGSSKKSNESEINNPINCIAFNQNEQYQNQFATVDESGRLALWDS